MANNDLYASSEQNVFAGLFQGPSETYGSLPITIAPWYGSIASVHVRVVLDKLSFASLQQAIRTPDERWLTYVRSLSALNLAAVTVSVATEHLWRKLRATAPKLTLPNASPTDDLGLSMSWNLDRYYLEIEVLPSGDYNWFYRDHDTRKGASENSQPVDAAPTERLRTALKAIFA